MTARKRTAHPGIEVRHRRHCSARDGGRCNCDPGYRAVAWSAADERKVAKTFPTLAAARAWRQDTQVGIRRGEVRTTSGGTVAEAAADFLAGMESGAIRNRMGEPYKPASRRSYARSIRLRVNPAIGSRKLAEIRRSDLQKFIDGMAAEGLDGSTIRNTIDPVRVIFRRAVQRDLIAVNPCTALEVPAPSGTRDRIAAPEEAERLLAEIPSGERALWATALYAGLRRGELRALRWADVDLASGVIRVERGWDDEEGEQDGKSKAARRTVPVAAVLRDYLMEHRMSATGEGEALVFGRTHAHPFDPTGVRRRALAAWKAANVKATAEAAEEGRDVDSAELLDPIGLHEARHTFASYLIAAGVDLKQVSTYLGHASISITADRYGHLLPGSAAEAAGKLDALLARSGGRGEVVGKSALTASVLERSAALSGTEGDPA